MKRIFLLLSFLTLSISLFAGHSENTRKNCAWLSKRYAANAHLATSKCGYSWSPAHDGDCSWAYAQVDRKLGCHCGITSSAMSQSNGSGHSSYLHLYCGTSGGYVTDLFFDITDDDGTIAESDASQEGSILPVFGNNTIAIENINIEIIGDENDSRNNTQTIAIWKPADDIENGIEDGDFTIDKALAYGTITLNNGEVTISGTLFSSSDFSITKEGTTITIVYIGEDKVFTVPSDENIDELAVNSSGDVVSDELTIINSYLKANNGTIKGNIEATIFLNPAVSELHLSFTKAIAQNAEITIYNIEGKKVDQPINIMNKSNASISLDISALNSGAYFIVIRSNDDKIIKKITKL